jgi:hypothetical protein
LRSDPNSFADARNIPQADVSSFAEIVSVDPYAVPPTTNEGGQKLDLGE